MSLILEALKKSEAERGGRPHAQAAPGAGSRRGARRLAVAMAVIALLGAAAGWWGSRQWSARAPEGAARVEPGPQAASRSEPVAVTEVPATGAPVIPGRPSTAIESAPAVPPVLASTERAAPANGEAEAGAGPASQASPAIPSAPPPHPRLVTVTGPSEAGPGRTRPAAPMDPPAVDGSPADAGQAESAGDLPRFDQLPGLRAEFGDLELNMLVYAAHPEARFALINLRRFEQGDQVQPGLELQEIRRDGVVLRLRGQAVLLPSGH